MNLKTTVDRIIQDYGEDIVHKTISSTTNDYGEITDEVASQETIKAVIGGALDFKVALEVYGIPNDITSSIIVSADVNVSSTDLFVIDGSETRPKNIRKIKFKGEHILTIVSM